MQPGIHNLCQVSENFLFKEPGKYWRQVWLIAQNVNNGSLSCQLIDMMILWLFFNIQGLMCNDFTAVVTGKTERWQVQTW